MGMNNQTVRELVGLSKNKTKKNLLYSVAFLILSSCANDQASFSLLPDSASFKQQSSSANNKVDVLWVIDNSSSMIPLQQNLINNFSSFIKNFSSKKLDYQMAVTTTDAFMSSSIYMNDLNYSKFRDGPMHYALNNGSYSLIPYGIHSGFNLVVPSLSDVVNTFVTNAAQGDQGSDDERAFSSIKAALSNTSNSGFVRNGSYLAIIILSDEDDFSSDSRVANSWMGKLPSETTAQYNARYVADHNYNYANLDTVDSYVSYLDTLTSSTSSIRHYNVNTVSVLDNTCLTQHNAQSISTIIGQRYIDIATKTNGSQGSICDTNFASTLDKLQEKILELSSQFYLQRIPVLSSVKVVVNGASISQDATNGWTYDSVANSIVFHGDAIPSEGAVININFDPTTIK